MPFAPLLFACSLVFDVDIGPVFTDFSQNIGLAVETSSPPNLCSSFFSSPGWHYDMQFLFWRLNYFLLLALCQPGSQQLCISKLFLKYILSTLYLCLGYQFQAHSVFCTYHIFCLFFYTFLISHHMFLRVFCSVWWWYRKQFEWRNILYMQLVNE